MQTLGSHLDLLKFGRRTATPRHQALKATLDWSYDHLSEIERVVLRRVAIFIGHFTAEAALAVVNEGGIDRSEIEAAVENLVNKSLLVASPRYRATIYRLLNTTRSYALAKLAASGEHDCVAARHASYSSQLSERSRIEDAAAHLHKIPGRVSQLRTAVGEFKG